MASVLVRNGVIAGLLSLAGCATGDPGRDSLPQAIQCAFTKACAEHVERRADALDEERSKGKRLQGREVRSRAELETSERALVQLREEVTALDASIARLQAEAEQAAGESAAARREMAGLRDELEALRADASGLQYDVLRENLDATEVSDRKRELEIRRDRLESALVAAL